MCVNDAVGQAPDCFHAKWGLENTITAVATPVQPYTGSVEWPHLVGPCLIGPHPTKMAFDILQSQLPAMDALNAEG